MTAYTHPEQTLVQRILVSCKIAILGTNIDDTESVKALWDTGATCTCISVRYAEQLGLQEEDKQIVTGANNQPFEVPVYSVQLKMGRFVIPYLRVCGLPMDGQEHDVIIGMDLMTKGDLSITNYGGKTVLSFREPSLERIDYCKEIEEARKYRTIHQTQLKHGNNKCPCGSGKKWENCHGKFGKP